MKTCNHCGDTKELSKDYFYPSMNTEDGYSDTCRVCSVQKTKQQEAKIKADRMSNRSIAPLSTKSLPPNERKQKHEESLARRRDITNALKQGHKSCGKCGETKRLFDFHANNRGLTGYSSWCKDCKKSSSVVPV